MFHADVMVSAMTDVDSDENQTDRQTDISPEAGPARRGAATLDYCS